ncbi:unnamed protein product [Enterobius vermicularis]|uniref:Acyl_transf_3 domain-containing protein n=1 Tax=Enterobius vermicularis TaxID=51028 RepID=A0A0N4VQ50_ENTVE|nr:unnamed protein product [Enterobius vermicularis]
MLVQQRMITGELETKQKIAADDGMRKRTLMLSEVVINFFSQYGRVKEHYTRRHKQQCVRKYDDSDEKVGTHKRRDIQGLRGIAIIYVLAFHLYPELFPYGFLGVDIFFVISGYLMAMTLLKEKAFTLTNDYITIQDDSIWAAGFATNILKYLQNLDYFTEFSSLQSRMWQFICGGVINILPKGYQNCPLLVAGLVLLSPLTFLLPLSTPVLRLICTLSAATVIYFGNELTNKK